MRIRFLPFPRVGQLESINTDRFIDVGKAVLAQQVRELLTHAGRGRRSGVNEACVTLDEGGSSPNAGVGIGARKKTTDPDERQLVANVAVNSCCQVVAVF